VDTTADAPALSDYAWGFPIEVGEEASFYAVELPLEVNQSVTDSVLRDAGVYNGNGNPVPRMFEQVAEEQAKTAWRFSVTATACNSSSISKICWRPMRMSAWSPTSSIPGNPTIMKLHWIWSGA
jgi:hypothetical protein